MEEDWELLHAADVALLTTSPKSSPSPVALADSSELDDVNSDYFAFASAGPSLGSEAFTEPNSELSLGGNAFPAGDFDGLWSNESSGGDKLGFGISAVNDESLDGESLLFGSQNVEFGGSKESVSEMEETVEKDEALVISSAADEAIEGNFQQIGLEAAEGEVNNGEIVEDAEKGVCELVKIEENSKQGVLESGCGEKKGVFWWKFPLELLKFCAFRVRPVWTIPVAAAIVGVMIFGRRLYRMKRKNRSIPLKLAIDDKKASKLMVSVAKLNEAFSVVRRVPVIGSSIPVRGSAPWPMLPLR